MMGLDELNLQAGWAVFIGVVAAVEDLRRRQVPNWIPVAAIVGGLAIALRDHGWQGAGSSLLGLVAGFAVFFVFYALGAMGGGDVKLMAGFGAVLGWSRIWEAALWTAAVGGLVAVLAIAVAMIRRRMSGSGSGSGAKAGAAEAIPYAPAIAIGSWLALAAAQ
jgi:prepilin peptidase CpaA